jgi:hypothetical protein
LPIGGVVANGNSFSIGKNDYKEIKFPATENLAMELIGCLQ